MCAHGWDEKMSRPQVEKFTFNFNYTERFCAEKKIVPQPCFALPSFAEALLSWLELSFPHLIIKYQQLNQRSQHSTERMLQIKVVAFFPFIYRWNEDRES